jgi:hypothetical protein
MRAPIAPELTSDSDLGPRVGGTRVLPARRGLILGTLSRGWGRVPS